MAGIAPQTIHSVPVGPQSCPHSAEPLAGVSTVHRSELVDVAAFARVVGLEATLRGEPDRLPDALRLRKVDQAAPKESLDRGRGRRGQVSARTAVREVARRSVERGRASAARGRHRRLGGQPTRLESGDSRADIAFDDLKPAVEIRWFGNPNDSSRM